MAPGCVQTLPKRRMHSHWGQTQRPLEPELCAQACLHKIRVSQGFMVFGIAGVKRPQVIIYESDQKIDNLGVHPKL